MRHWRWPLLALVGWLGVTALTLALLLFLPSRHNITKESYARIQPGMTRSEVEELLGGAPGIYGREKPRWVVYAHPGFWNGVQHNLEFWQTEEIWIGVWFDPQQRVAYKETCQPPHMGRPTLRQQLRRYLPFLLLFL